MVEIVGQHFTGPPGGLAHLVRLFGRHGGRLFTHDVTPRRQRLHHMFMMKTVRRADADHIRAHLCQQRGDIRENVPDGVAFCERLRLFRATVTDSRQLHLSTRAVKRGMNVIRHLTGTNNGHLQRRGLMSTHFARRLLTLTQEVKRLPVGLRRVVGPDAAFIDDIAVIAVSAQLIERAVKINRPAARLVAMIVGDKGGMVRSFGNLPNFLG